MTIDDQKKALRNQMRIKRETISGLAKAKYDQRICESLWEIVQENNFKTVHCYLPMRNEINITPLLEILLKNGITVITPKTLPKRKLKNLVLESFAKLEKGVFGTFHPKGDNEYSGNFDLIVVPGLAFDSNNYRLGYGGGYYDNFLVNQPSAKKIGIFYPFQEVENVPIEQHDVQLDQILMDREILEL